MKLIPLSKNGKNKGKYFAQVDDEDFDWLNQFNWCAAKIRKVIYVLKPQSKTCKFRSMHRMILNLKGSGILCDHKDMDGLNNQRNNLRIATCSENGANTRPRGKSKYLGVSYFASKSKYIDKNGQLKIYSYPAKWAADIRSNKTRKHLGFFETEIEAAKAYDIIARMLHGDFANLNFK